MDLEITKRVSYRDDNICDSLNNPGKFKTH